jgi:hypothetical protein
MQSYTVDNVIRLMQNYLDFRYNQEGSVQQLPETTMYVAPKWRGELPLGMRPTDLSAWPFREPRHAKEPRDGKAKAKQIELIWVSMLDLERGLSHLPDDDLTLMYKYYVFQTHTLDELAVDLGTEHASTVLRRLQRIAKKLTQIMENSNNNRRDL